MAAPRGTAWGSAVNDMGRVGIYATRTDGTSSTITFQIWFWSKWSVSDSTNTLYFDDNATSATTSKGSTSISTTVSAGTGWSESNQVLLGTYTATHNKTSATQTINCAAKLSSVDEVGGDMTAIASYTVPKAGSGGGSSEPEPRPPVDVKSATVNSNATPGGSVFQACCTIRVEAKNDTQMQISMWRAIHVKAGSAFEGANAKYSGTLGSGSVRLYNEGWYADSGVPVQGWFNRGTTVTHTFTAQYTGGSGTTYKASATCSYEIPLLDTDPTKITVYDSAGNAREAEVTVYDEDGNARTVEITAYL